MNEEELFHERLRVVVSPESTWARRRKISLRDLAGEAWIIAPHEADPGAPLFEGFRAAGVEMPPINIFSYSLSLRCSLLSRGSFITAVPASALEFGALKKLIVALPIDLPPWRRPIVMTTLKDRTLSPAAQALMTCVRELCRPLR